MDIKKNLVAIAGSDSVFHRRQELEAYSRDYSLTPPGRPNYVVQAGNVAQIQQVIKLANEYRMPVIPSSSTVHFHGATLPRQGGILLDLRRLNRILEVDKRNRKLRIEPGVTWGQLQPELAKQDWMVISPLLPHHQSSVVTSLLEREPPLIPKYEYGEPLLTMEVVFPDGEVRRSGSSSTPGAPDNAQVDGTYPQGPGIDWFRLLQGAQGTMGIVTWANIKTEYAPRLNKTFFLPFQQIEEAIEPLYRIQRHMLGYECFLLNSPNAATILAQDSQNIAILKRNLPAWTLFLVVGGPRRRPEAKIQYEEEALREINTQFPGLEILSALPGMPGLETRLPSTLRRPWPKSHYWKHSLKGGCQDLFCLTRPQEAPRFMALVSQLAGEHGYSVEELGCYLQPIEQGRACHLEFNFYYNPKDADDVNKIRGLYAETASALLDAGAFFSRPYGLLANMVYSQAAAYTSALKKVKNLLDPNNILNPGSLCF